uniref:tRNA-synt_His domain-containing protein n=1 Tax=Parastrongyloides trichosuri TaxID=131310 RepID=A0A0N5A049_PARTI
MQPRLHLCGRHRLRRRRRARPSRRHRPDMGRDSAQSGDQRRRSLAHPEPGRGPSGAADALYRGAGDQAGPQSQAEPHAHAGRRRGRHRGGRDRHPGRPRLRALDAGGRRRRTLHRLCAGHGDPPDPGADPAGGAAAGRHRHHADHRPAGAAVPERVVQPDRRADADHVAGLRLRLRRGRARPASPPAVPGPVRPDPRRGLLVRRHPVALRLVGPVRDDDAVDARQAADLDRSGGDRRPGDLAGRADAADGAFPRGDEQRRGFGRGRGRLHRRLSERLGRRSAGESEGVGDQPGHEPAYVCLLYDSADDAGAGPVQGGILPRPDVDARLWTVDGGRGCGAGPAGRAGMAGDSGWGRGRGDRRLGDGGRFLSVDHHPGLCVGADPGDDARGGLAAQGSGAGGADGLHQLSDPDPDHDDNLLHAVGTAPVWPGRLSDAVGHRRRRLGAAADLVAAVAVEVHHGAVRMAVAAPELWPRSAAAPHGLRADAGGARRTFLPDADRPNEGVFALQDDDDQWMALRYDHTAPLARFAAQNWETLPKPFRRYAYGPVWRNEKPGPGRFREFWQPARGGPGGGAGGDPRLQPQAVRRPVRRGRNRRSGAAADGPSRRGQIRSPGRRGRAPVAGRGASGRVGRLYQGGEPARLGDRRDRSLPGLGRDAGAQPRGRAGRRVRRRLGRRWRRGAEGTGRHRPRPDRHGRGARRRAVRPDHCARAGILHRRGVRGRAAARHQGREGPGCALRLDRRRRAL